MNVAISVSMPVEILGPVRRGGGERLWPCGLASVMYRSFQLMPLVPSGQALYLKKINIGH